MIDLDLLLKEQDVYLTKFPDGSRVVWKLLSVRQYNLLRSLTLSGVYTEGYARCRAFELCNLEPNPLINKMPAGFIDAIGGTILWLSGDCNNDTFKEDIATVRNIYTGGTSLEYMTTVILTAFPMMVLDDVHNLSRNKLIHLFVQAENILHYRIGQDFNYLDLEKIGAKPEEVQKHKYDVPDFNERIGVDPYINEELEYDPTVENMWKKALSEQQARELDNRGR